MIEGATEEMTSASLVQHLKTDARNTVMKSFQLSSAYSQIHQEKKRLLLSYYFRVVRIQKYITEAVKEINTI